MIRIVYIPVEDTKRTTRFLTELTESDLLDIKELIAINILSVNGERLHKIEMFQNYIQGSMGDGGRGEPYGL